jgi:hypothetical protein
VQGMLAAKPKAKATRYDADPSSEGAGFVCLVLCVNRDCVVQLVATRALRPQRGAC